MIENGMVIGDYYDEDFTWEDADYKDVLNYMYDRDQIHIAMRDAYYMSDGGCDLDNDALTVIFGDLNKRRQEQIVERYREKHDRTQDFKEWKGLQ